MTVLWGKIAALATKAAHSNEVRHDAALFAGTFAATGLLGDLTGGQALGWDVLVAAVITAARRAVALRLAGK